MIKWQISRKSATVECLGNSITNISGNRRLVVAENGLTTSNGQSRDQRLVQLIVVHAEKIDDLGKRIGRLGNLCFLIAVVFLSKMKLESQPTTLI